MGGGVEGSLDLPLGGVGGGVVEGSLNLPLGGVGGGVEGKLGTSWEL